MGTVNYRTSDYITLGIKPYDNCNAYECELDNIRHILNKCCLEYFSIEIVPGYYEGFSVDIKSNYPTAFSDYKEKRDADKEITEIKQLLIESAGCGLVACHPGWATGYESYADTIKAIQAAVKKMREEIKRTPTWRQYLAAI